MYGAPETFLVDGSGRVLFKFISPMTAEVWEHEFLPRIAARAGAARERRERSAQLAALTARQPALPPA